MNSLLEALKLRNWDIQRSSIESPLLPTEFLPLQPTLPESFIEWLNRFDICTNATRTSWFLSRLDYSGSTDAQFRWNEIQLMSLENCETELERKSVNHFWRSHIPIALAVSSDYDYLAISLNGSDFGAVVHGAAPEWEDASTISATFSGFLAQFELEAASDTPRWPYALFL